MDNHEISRRNFMGLGIGAAVGFGLAGCATGPAYVPRSVSDYRGVEVGTITYSYRSMPCDAESIVKYAKEGHLGTLELMGSVVDAYLGKDRDLAKLPALKKLFDDAGISIHIVKYGAVGTGSDADNEYYFKVAKALGAPCITREVPAPKDYETIGRRCAALADKYGVCVAFHNHTQIDALTYDGPLLGYSPRLKINFDIGHYVAASDGDPKRFIDPLAFIEKYHDRIYSIHLKDRTTKAHGAKNLQFGQGDTPLAGLFPFMQDRGYRFPCDIELEYAIPKDSNAAKEVRDCNLFCRIASGCGPFKVEEKQQ